MSIAFLFQLESPFLTLKNTADDQILSFNLVHFPRHVVGERK